MSSAHSFGPGCASGIGGAGGAGAGGNGGAGGSSLALAYSGIVPNINGTDVTGDIDALVGWTTTASPAPNHGVGGLAGDRVQGGQGGEPGADGPDGVVKAVVQLPTR